MKEIIKKVDELVEVIKNSDKYKNYLLLKEKLKNDEEIMLLIDEIKDSQKKIVKLKIEQKDFSMYEKLIDKNLELLHGFPIYVEFSYLQSDLNLEFQIIKDSIESEINKITN